MTGKPKLKIDWPTFIKGAVILLTSIGAVGTGTVMLGGNDSEAGEVRPMVVQHIATDSVRWVYTEKRLERIESDLQEIKQDQKEIIKILTAK